MKNILELSPKKAKKFLLKQESYLNIDLPPYIQFKQLLNELSEKLNGHSFINFKKEKKINPAKIEGVNYKLLHNKNGKYDWRPFELINPVLYVSLVQEITKKENWKLIKKRFKYIQKNSVVECMSLPVVSTSKKSDKAEQILNWWEQVEQKSLELSLKYSYIYHTDITDCYGAIYTHSIPWALHTKKIAKTQEFKNDKSYIGNQIDFHIQSMSYGQTNGIPQGSILMDFVAEIVLNYADLLLSEKISNIKKNSFKIIRYRDDYRILTNSPQVAEDIIKHLSEVLISLGLKLHSQKTTSSDNVICGSIKSDKMSWLNVKSNVKTIQEELLILHKFALQYSNSGTLQKELSNILKKIHKWKNIKQKENINVLIGIVVDIAYLNPRTYSVSIAIISALLNLLDKKDAEKIVKKIIAKFKTIPNTGHMQIWLQRAIIKLDLEDSYFDEKICKLVYGSTMNLWDIGWLNKSINEVFDKNNIVNTDIIDKLDKEIGTDEVLLFDY